MKMEQIHEYARKLIESHGAAAEAEAAARLKQAEQSGDAEKIQNWQRIRAAVRERKAAHVS
jgi:hypothetical protein